VTLIRRSLRDAAPYEPGEQPPPGEDWIKLNTNESPLEPSARVGEAIRRVVARGLRRYPQPQADEVRRVIAGRLGIDPAGVVVGNGADELLRLAFTAFAEPGDRVAYPWPTYSLLPVLARVQGLSEERHAWPPGEPLPGSFALSDAPLKVLTNPNAPTGALVPCDTVGEVCAQSPGVVVLDEAYADFARTDCAHLVERHGNLLVLRTLSKSYALAGMRVGFAVGGPEVVRGLELVRDSYPVDSVAAAAAVAALEDQRHHRHIVELVIRERERLSGALREMGFTVLPSEANFVMARPPQGSEASGLCAQLRERRILVRHFAHDPLAGWIRVTVGNPEENSALIDALSELGVRA
jgi:histidinol-phosphate aminotransferase